MRYRLLSLVLSMTISPALGQQSAPPAGPRIDVQSYDIEMQVKPENAYLEGTARIRFRPVDESLSVPFELNSRLSVIEVTDPEGNRYSPSFDNFNSSRMLVRASEPFKAGTERELIFRFDGTLETQEFAYLDNAPRTEKAVIGPEGASLLSEGRWFPSHNLRVDAAQVSVKVTVPLGFTVVAPGRLDPIETVGVSEIFSWHSNGPVNAAPVLISRYYRQEFDESPTPLTFYVTENFDRDLQPLADQLNQIVQFFTQTYGAPAPFENLNLVQVGNLQLPSTGSAGLVLLEQSLLDAKTLPVLELARRIARQWWGYRLFVDSASDVWLQEGFADYAALRYIEEKHPERFPAELAKSAVDALKYEDRAPIIKGVELGEGTPQFDSIVGSKSAQVLFMLRQLVGREKFEPLLVKWYQEHAGESVTTTQFVDFVNRDSDGEFNWFFLQWVESTGVPEFKVDYTILKVSDGGFKIKGQIKQDLELFRMPVDVLIETKGKPEEKQLTVSGKNTSFDFETETMPVRVVLDPHTRILHDSEQMRVAVNLALGEEFLDQGEFVSAIREFEKAKTLDPRSSLAHYRLAEAFFLQHSYSNAANSFRDALNGDLKPEWVETWTHIHLGKIYDILNQRQRALAEYQKAANSGVDYNGALAEAQKYINEPFTKPTTAIN